MKLASVERQEAQEVLRPAQSAAKLTHTCSGLAPLAADARTVSSSSPRSRDLNVATLGGDHALQVQREQPRPSHPEGFLRTRSRPLRGRRRQVSIVEDLARAPLKAPDLQPQRSPGQGHPSQPPWRSRPRLGLGSRRPGSVMAYVDQPFHLARPSRLKLVTPTSGSSACSSFASTTAKSAFLVYNGEPKAIRSRSTSTGFRFGVILVDQLRNLDWRVAQRRTYLSGSSQCHSRDTRESRSPLLQAQ